MLSSVLFLFASLVTAHAAGVEQVHIAYTGVPGDVSVDFVSDNAAGTVFYGLSPTSSFESIATTSFNFVEIGYMHQAIISFPGIPVGTPAYYFVSSPTANSSVFEIFPVPSRNKHAVFGDFGLTNDECLDDLIKQAQAGNFDSVLHVGDFAYNFETLFSAVGNGFMNAIQPYAAVLPVMPMEGNHEACEACLGVPELPLSTGNFSQYRARFHSVTLGAGAVSGSDTNRYYSFSQGLTHFIVFTAEAYLYARDATFLQNQLAFITADLAKVDRTVTPWLVALAHKDWTMETEAFAAISPIFNAAGVDVLFCGHVHYYNRYMPYDSVTGVVDSASVSADGSTYTNPKYTTVIVTGASGDIERDDTYTKQSPSFTGTENYGYGFFEAINETVAVWNFHTVTPDGSGPADYSDSLTIIQNNRKRST